MPLPPDIRYFRTGIQTLDDLLLPFTRESGPARDCRGLAFNQNVGFFGAVFGSAGRGKSILAMQMAAVCGGVTDQKPGLCNASGVSQPATFSSVYITQESVELIRDKILGFGWKHEEQIHLPGSMKFLDLKQAGLHLANFDLNQESQAGMLRNIFDAVARSAGPAAERFVLICFDNAETILPGAYSELVGSTPTDKNFYKAVRDFCKKRRLHLMMFFEEREEGIDGRTLANTGETVAMTSQAYAADLVVRLGSHFFKSGYKERSIEIVKAKNQYHRRGAHHFSIVPGGTSREGGTPGLVIYESLATQLYALRYPDSSGEREKPVVDLAKAGNFGIRSLDDRISQVLSSLSGGVAVDRFLSPGTVSVLVCDLDVRVSEIALHFAFRPQDLPIGNGDFRPVPSDCVYISFLNPWRTMLPELNGFSPSKWFSEKLPENFVCFDPEHISEGKLLQDIRRHIKIAQKRLAARDENKLPIRVVVDNLYALEAKFPLIQNSAHFITALFAQLRELSVIALVLDTVEVGEGRNPLDKSFAAGLGQNVFLLRHVELQARAHTAFSVVQIIGHRTPDTLWDILDDKNELRASDTFKYYKNVLSGRPELVKVRMSIHADAKDSPLDKYLKAKSRALSQTLGQTLELHCYRPDDYEHVHGAFSLARHQPLSDCHVISIDETWLEDLLKSNELEEISPSGRYSGAVTTCHDLALSYLQNDSSGRQSCLNHVYAIPDRNNCGVLAVCKTSLISKHSILAPAVDSMFTSSPLTWGDLVELKKRFWTVIPRLTANEKDAGQRNPLFFTFCRDQAESCVSFLLELAVASVPIGGSLVGNNRRLMFFDEHGSRNGGGDIWDQALSLFIELLEPVDQKSIAIGEFRKSSEEHGSILSRQWFNTCIVLRSNVTDQHPEEFTNILIRDLPLGKRGIPAVVSGAWYYGILKGSAAIEAGVEVISQFTSPEKASPGEDLRKANAGIGLPVRGEYYGPDKESIELVHPPPYRERFFKISQIDLEGGVDRVKKIADACETEFPFYRMRIARYRHVMPIIWGMMVQAAKRAYDPNNDGIFRLDAEVNKTIRYEAQQRYDAVLDLDGESSNDLT